MPAPAIHAPWLRLDLQQMLIEIATPLGLCKKATQAPEKLTALELANLLIQSPISDTIVQPILIKIPQEVTQAAHVLRSLAPESLQCAPQPTLTTTETLRWCKWADEWSDYLTDYKENAPWSNEYHLVNKFSTALSEWSGTLARKPEIVRRDLLILWCRAMSDVVASLPKTHVTTIDVFARLRHAFASF